MPSRRGQKGKAAGYSLKQVRGRERALTEQAERAYRQLVADWQAKAPPAKRAWRPPPMGRDFQVTKRDTLRGRAKLGSTDSLCDLSGLG
jgi:hypothetical protein